MFSSLLPKPKNTTLETAKIVLAKKNVQAARLPKAILDQTPFSQAVVSAGHEAVQNAVEQLFFNSDGTIDYSKTLACAAGCATSAQSSYEETIPLKIRYPRLKHHFPRYTLETCPDDSLRRSLEETRQVIAGRLARAAGAQEKTDGVTIQFTPSVLDQQSKTIHITELKEDPMLPPKFKLRKNRESLAGPPPPILKAPTTEKITKEVKDQWHIPASVSNWKNNQGFTISLHKRVNAASGGALPKGTDFNFEKFSRLSLTLDSVDAQARKDLEAKYALKKQEDLHELARGADLKGMLEQAKRKRASDERPSGGKPRHR